VTYFVIATGAAELTSSLSSLLPSFKHLLTTHLPSRDVLPSNQLIGYLKFFAFNALTLLVGHHEEHPACKN